MVVKKIPQGNYAKFIIKGHMQRAVGEFWSNLWGLSLDRKYSSDFEEYQNNSGDMENQEIHIFIALNDLKKGLMYGFHTGENNFIGLL